ncbi:hypothetical protein C8Q80DRAFT_1104704 [Daedaleopsis nitida]|nr:hypothetical protein C8Q80DRAFT_1104704 [Daedaleopsis nitida]
MASSNESGLTSIIPTETAPKLYGVARALATSPSSEPLSPTLFTEEFSLKDRVALVTGANRGIGLEAALALAEAGARAVYCLDLPREPGEEWTKVQSFVARMGLGRFEYVCGDVRDQDAMLKLGETIGEKEGRMDVCVAAAGIAMNQESFLTVRGKDFQDVMDVNVNGVLFTAQAAGRQMERFGNGGSITLIASMCGTIALEPTLCNIAYHSSKSALLQMARSMACELGMKRIRVNTLSPGWIGKTGLTKMFDENPQLLAHCERSNPMGRVGRPEELRGVVVWLASDASSFCTGSNIMVSGGQHAW